MQSNFIGNSIVFVNGPYEVNNSHDFYSTNLGITEEDVNAVIEEALTTGDHQQTYGLACNILQNIEISYFEQWASFSKMESSQFRSYLINAIINANINNHQLELTDIPLFESPIISISENAFSDFTLGKSGKEKFYTFPDEGVGLYTELAKLKAFDIRSLKKFARSFGLPVGINFSSIPNFSIPSRLAELEQYNNLLYFAAAPISRIYMDLIEYQNVFNNFIAIKTNNLELAKILFLKQSFVNEISFISPFDMDAKDKINRTYEKYNNLENKPDVLSEKAITSCRKFLADAINKKTSMATKIVGTVDLDFIEQMFFSSLFDIAYNQMRISLLNGSELRKCEYCGHYFEPQHGKQKFCSALPFNKRSSCENAYNQMKNKQRREGGN